jgi:hypothetical protein
MLIRDIITRMRHDGCGGRAGKVELMTSIDGASSRPGAQDRAARGVMARLRAARRGAGLLPTAVIVENLDR